MDISIVIAQILGILFTLVGISMVVNSKATATAIGESVQDRGMLWMWGFLAVLTGAVIVTLNNTWTSGMPLLVTILGWLALVKGMFILVFPGAAVSLYGRLNKSGIFTVCGVVVLVIGLAMLYW